MALRPLVAALLFCASELLAAAIDGYVLNPQTQSRVPQIEVAFYIRQDDSQVSEVMRKMTDAGGRFSFSGPFLQDGLEFALAAFYDGVPYFSSTLEAGAQQQIILEVYETTTDASGLDIDAHHLFLSLREGTIECIQLLQIRNTLDRTYAGQGSGRERRVTEVALPLELFNLQGHSGLIHQPEPGRFFYNQPLPPGPSQLSFSFELNARQFDGDYVHQVIYPTERLVVFLDPPTINVGPPFIDQGTVELHDRQYRRVEIQNLQPGQVVEIPLPHSRSLRWLLKWAALAGTFAALGAALALRRGQPLAASGPAPRDRQRVIAKIARLDDEYAHYPDDPAYRQRRALLVREAVALTQALEE